MSGDFLRRFFQELVQLGLILYYYFVKDLNGLFNLK